MKEMEPTGPDEDIKRSKSFTSAMHVNTKANLLCFLVNLIGYTVEYVKFSTIKVLVWSCRALKRYDVCVQSSFLGIYNSIMCRISPLYQVIATIEGLHGFRGRIHQSFRSLKKSKTAFELDLSISKRGTNLIIHAK